MKNKEYKESIKDIDPKEPYLFSMWKLYVRNIWKELLEVL